MSLKTMSAGVSPRSAGFSARRRSRLRDGPRSTRCASMFPAPSGSTLAIRSPPASSLSIAACCHVPYLRRRITFATASAPRVLVWSMRFSTFIGSRCQQSPTTPGNWGVPSQEPLPAQPPTDLGHSTTNQRRVREATRRKYTPEENIRVVPERFRGEVTVVDLCQWAAPCLWHRKGTSDLSATNRTQDSRRHDQPINPTIHLAHHTTGGQNVYGAC
jgi:hypothetical protein